MIFSQDKPYLDKCATQFMGKRDPHKTISIQTNHGKIDPLTKAYKYLGIHQSKTIHQKEAKN